MSEIFPESPLTSLPAAVAAMGALPVPVGPQPQALSDERLTEIVESHPGDWYSGEWRSEDYSAGEFSEYIVKHVESDTVLAELPDWAGPLALFFADAHDAVPELVVEVRRLRAQVAELSEALSDAAEALRARQSCPCPPADQPGPHQLGCPQAEVPVSAPSERPVNELTAAFMPVAALREDEPLKGRARLDASAAVAAEATHWKRLGIEDPHDGSARAPVPGAPRPARDGWDPMSATSPAVCRCDEPDADPYECEADDCTGEFSELNPFGGGPVHGHDAKVSRVCGCGWRTSVWHVDDGSAEEELHGHAVRVHGGTYPSAKTGGV